MDLSKSTREELVALCKERKIRGYSGKKKEILIQLLETPVSATITSTTTAPATTTPAQTTTPTVAATTAEPPQPQREDVFLGDALQILPTLADESAQIILADPPYNIGKDFGNDSDRMPMNEYLDWCDKWIAECLRVLKPNGTMFLFGFSENLALVTARIPQTVNRRWIVWHYTNKNVASLNFWQRSHESILVLWKQDKVFHRDEVREAYTEGFLNGAAGKERASTKGRFSKGDKTTTYTAHPAGALPRDVIKIPALAGGAGMKERVNHPTQKPLALCEKLIKSCKQADGYVLVPFAGSGSECLAAKNLGLPFVGIEINEEYVQLTRDRLNPPPQEAEEPSSS